MRSKKTGLHPFLILLAVALVSVLFVVSCGDDEATAVPRAADTGAAEAAAASAAASQAAKAAETAAMAAEEAVAQAADLAAAAQTAGTGESEAVEAALAAAAQAVAAAQAAAAQAATEFDALRDFTAAAIELSEEAAAQAAAAQAAAAADEGAPKYGGTLRVGSIADSASLDPAIGIATPDVLIHQQVYDNLLMIQPDLSVKPELATSWEPNADNSSYTFNLRKGVKFHHGKDFKAEDVVFTFNRLLDPVIDSPVRATLEVIDEMVIIDDYTVRFDLVAPNSFFPTYLSVFQARILPADVDLERLTLEEFGTGPFILEEYLPGERATMVPFDDYWEEGKPYLDEIVHVGIPEAAALVAALENGDIDLVYELPTQSVAAIEANPDTKVLNANSWSWIGLDMDTASPPFNNKLVRQAFQAATDRNLIIQAATVGLGSPAFDHPIHPANPVFASQYAPPDYDIELAKSLLQQAGYPDGIDVKLHTADVAQGMIELAVAYKESAAPAGIRIEVQREPSDGFWETVWGQVPLTIERWFGRNPDQALTIQFHSDSAWNVMHYNNPELDALIEKARGENLEDQKVTYGEIQRILIDDVPAIVVAFQPWLYGVRSNLRGADPHPLGWGLFQEAWFDD